jgi:hypothetical protein
MIDFLLSAIFKKHKGIGIKLQNEQWLTSSDISRNKSRNYCNHIQPTNVTRQNILINMLDNVFRDKIGKNYNICCNNRERNVMKKDMQTTLNTKSLLYNANNVACKRGMLSVEMCVSAKYKCEAIALQHLRGPDFHSMSKFPDFKTCKLGTVL